MRFSAYPNEQIPGIGLYIYNGGLGPAWVETVAVHLDGSEVSLSRLVELLSDEWVAEVTEAGREAEAQIDFRISNSNLDYREACVIPEGDFVMLVEVRAEDWTPSRGEFLSGFFARTAVDLSYASVYGERFEMKQGADQEGR